MLYSKQIDRNGRINFLLFSYEKQRVGFDKDKLSIAGGFFELLL